MEYGLLQNGELPPNFHIREVEADIADLADHGSLEGRLAKPQRKLVGRLRWTALPD